MARMSKFAKSVFQLLLLILISLVLNQRSVKLVKKVGRFVHDMRHILLWTKFPGLEEEGQTMFMKKQCNNINCYFTTNRSLLGDVRYFDAIVFNLEDVAGPSLDLPKLRSKTQKYIFAANDSADNFPVCNPIYDNFFNWSWSYRVDSSIPFKYVSVYTYVNHHKLSYDPQWIPHVQMKPISKLVKASLQTKSKAAAIFLDECKSNSRREVYIKGLQHELSKYNLTLDVFGKCGSLTCARRNMKACYYRLKVHYYFYLALEDSIALDFMTDVVLNGYEHQTVPIVYGGAEYAKFLPPHSYLDATMLTQAVLAKTMYDIICHKERYYDYFKWNKYYEIKATMPMNICTLCYALNTPKWLQINVTYTEFRRWWNPEYEKRCGLRKTYWFF